MIALDSLGLYVQYVGETADWIWSLILYFCIASWFASVYCCVRGLAQRSKSSGPGRSLAIAGLAIPFVTLAGFVIYLASIGFALGSVGASVLSEN